MSTARNEFPQPPQAASSQPNRTSEPSRPAPILPPSDTIMDQHLDSTLTLTPPAPRQSPELTMSSTAPNQDDSTPPSNASTIDSAEATSSVMRQHPIPPASEPMQYRAIGLVRGRYVPSEEQFTRGTMHTDDGAEIDAVLLGRVMSLVKKHIDLEQSHLWVVYPRTREDGTDLHIQVVGIWEPEKLNRDDEPDGELDGESLDEDNADESLSSASDLPMVDPSELDDRYFSIRGEIVHQSIENEELHVKIRRLPNPRAKQTKAFKVALKGVLNGKALGYFWDIHVERQEKLLVVRDATLIGMVPPQKRGKSDPDRRRGPGGPGGPRKRFGPPREGGMRPPSRPMGGGDRPQRPAPPPSRPSAPVSKPIIKRRKDEES